MTDIDRIFGFIMITHMIFQQHQRTQDFRYKCSLNAINNLKLKLQVTILGESREMLAFCNRSQRTFNCNESNGYSK